MVARRNAERSGDQRQPIDEEKALEQTLLHAYRTMPMTSITLREQLVLVFLWIYLALYFCICCAIANRSKILMIPFFK